VTRLLLALGIACVLAGCGPGAETSATDTVPVSAPVADSSAARDVLLRYYAAIEARHYRSAYELWSQGGAASGQTYGDFAAGFAHTAHTQVEFTGPVTIEGAAGSLYATVPVLVRAATTADEPQVFVGNYELRRVNDVPGATPEQLRWHIHGANLEPVP